MRNFFQQFSIMKNKLFLIYTWLVRSVLFFLPDIPFIMRFRGWLYGLPMIKCGKDFQVPHDARLTGLQWMVIGNHVVIGNLSVFFAHGIITLEDEVLVGPMCMFSAGNHTKINGSYRYGQSEISSIRICAGSWVAANCTVIGGAVLPQGSVLGANSLLNKSYDISDSLYGGVPAKLITQKSNN